jgi:Tol biopolymer transport system component
LPIASLRLTPDGKTVVFARGTEANSSGEIADPTSNVQKRTQQVWAVKVDQGEPQLLGDMGCEEEGCEDIQVSPNGEIRSLVAKKQLWIAPISGSEKAHVLTYARGNISQPKWSPDGKKIAFVSNRGDHSFVAIYQFGRETLQYVLPTPDRDIHPRWSPDGNQLAFVRVAGKLQKQPILPQTPEPWRSGFTIWPLTKAPKCGIAGTHSTIPFLV